MNQNEMLQLVAETFTANEYFEQTPTGMQIRHMIVPDPADEPIMVDLKDETGQPLLNEDGSAVQEPMLDEDGLEMTRPLPLLLGELETIPAYKLRMNLEF